MSKFVNPEIEIIKFSVEDIITASSGGSGGGIGGDSEMPEI